MLIYVSIKGNPLHGSFRSPKARSPPRAPVLDISAMHAAMAALPKKATTPLQDEEEEEEPDYPHEGGGEEEERGEASDARVSEEGEDDDF